MIVALVAGLYAAAVIVSGWIYMGVQNTMRQEWRGRLYRFVPDADYRAMVLVPAERTENMFRVTAVAGSLIGLLAVSLVFLAP